MGIYPFLNAVMENDHLPVEELGQCRWLFVIFQFREGLDTCRSSLDSHPWCHTSWTRLRWSHFAETHCKPRRCDTLNIWIMSSSRGIYLEIFLFHNILPFSWYLKDWILQFWTQQRLEHRTRTHRSQCLESTQRCRQRCDRLVEINEEQLKW